MRRAWALARVWIAFLLAATMAAAQQPFPVISTVDAPSIAGRPVVLDGQGKLLPWPMPDNTGYSYSGYFLSQWTVLLDQYDRQRLSYYFCCFDFDRTTFEMFPDWHWANSTGYLRAMMTGFIERLYPYTGDERTLEFLENFVDYELENGLTPEGYAWARVPYPSANPGSRRYTGWSEHGEDYIEPHVVMVGGKAIERRSDLGQQGYTFDEQQKTLRIRHTSSRDVDIRGKGDQAPPKLITFDDPHLAAGTPLLGQYPSGIIDWGAIGKDGAEWEIGTPFGKFGTFTFKLADPESERGEFAFASPRIFAGIDVYNDGEHDATVTVSSPEIREQAFTVKAKELRRIRTGWRDPSSRVRFKVVNGEALRFDNLAYLSP